jgi:nitrate/nitrite transport system permease protein
MTQASVSFRQRTELSAPRWYLPSWSREATIAVLELLAAIAVLLGIWLAAAALAGKDLPGPAQTLSTFWELVSNPFYDKGPNDKGIGLQLAGSLGRVFTGFGLGAVVAIPLGILMGAWAPARGALNPMVQILRPVSPLAWFPIGLAAFHAAPTATVFVIFITSLWPTVINTAFGVASIPKDHQHVAQVFGFSRMKYVRKVILPYSLPHILTGARLSMGIAWMVIVAAEMLAGGMGVGFFVWDSWNSLKVDRILSAILLIGFVGLVLDRLFDALARRAAYEG